MADNKSKGLVKADELASGLTNNLTNDNGVIRNLERLSEEDPDGFSSDVLNYINSLKAKIQQLQVSTMVCEQRDLIIENSKLITLNWGNPLVVAIKSEAIREFAEKIDQLFDRYAHILSHADCARKDYIKTDDGTEIEMQSVWDVFRLEKHGIAEYEEMNRLQENIELIEKGRLLAELKKDFRLLVKEMTEGNNAE